MLWKYHSLKSSTAGCCQRHLDEQVLHAFQCKGHSKAWYPTQFLEEQLHSPPPANSPCILDIRRNLCPTCVKWRMSNITLVHAAVLFTLWRHHLFTYSCIIQEKRENVKDWMKSPSSFDICPSRSKQNKPGKKLFAVFKTKKILGEHNKECYLFCWGSAWKDSISFCLCGWYFFLTLRCKRLSNGSGPPLSLNCALWIWNRQEGRVRSE